jgi:hypothetical protein
LQKELLDNMEEQFWAVQRKYGLAIGDFPDINKFKYALLLSSRPEIVPRE